MALRRGLSCRQLCSLGLTLDPELDPVVRVCESAMSLMPPAWLAGQPARAVGSAGHRVRASSHFDFLEVLDHHTRESPSGESGRPSSCICSYRSQSSLPAGCCRPSDRQVSSSTDRPRPGLLHGVPVTALGRVQADRIRRLHREALTDAVRCGSPGHSRSRRAARGNGRACPAVHRRARAADSSQARVGGGQHHARGAP